VLNRHAYSGGADWLLRFDGGDYELSGFAGFSRVDGSAADIRRVQTAPARYFQRPDAGHVNLDSTRTALDGWTAALRAERVGGAHWLWGGGVTAESPEFELNDAGQLQSADDVDGWAQIRYRETTPGRVFRNYNVALTSDAGMNFGGVRQYTGVYLEGDCTWRNFMRNYAELTYGFGGLSDDHLRGGPLFRNPTIWSSWLEFGGNHAATTQWEVETGYAHNDLGGWQWQILGEYAALRRRLRPWRRATRTTAKRQYVAAAMADPGASASATCSPARPKHRTVAVGRRLHAGLTLGLRSRSHRPGAGTTELRRRAPAFPVLRHRGTTIERAPNDDLTITDGADTLFARTRIAGFQGLSFRSSFVLRWEWRRGSTLFFIWQADRSEFQQSDELVRPGDLWDAFTAPGDDLLAVKATYWFSVD
jgi:hypothetical protein